VDLTKIGASDTVCEIVDPAASYGLRIVSDSPEITALQTFAPPDRPMLVIEPQFSLADPYGTQWPKNVETGMVVLQPGRAVEYKVRLELFKP
jgi:galactose mutarotase-like enzyme